MLSVCVGALSCKSARANGSATGPVLRVQGDLRVHVGMTYQPPRMLHSQNRSNKKGFVADLTRRDDRKGLHKRTEEITVHAYYQRTKGTGRTRGYWNWYLRTDRIPTQVVFGLTGPVLRHSLDRLNERYTGDVTLPTGPKLRVHST